jgi:hypothetical protein
LSKQAGLIDRSGEYVWVGHPKQLLSSSVALVPCDKNSAMAHESGGTLGVHVPLFDSLVEYVPDGQATHMLLSNETPLPS